MLQFQNVQTGFRFGINEGTDPHQLPHGTLTTAENVVWKKSGRLQKRFGTASMTQNITGGGTLSACSRLVTRGSELALIDGSNLYAYSSETTTWTSVGKVPEASMRVRTLLDTATGVGQMDLAVSSAGLIVQAWIVGDPTSGTPQGALFVQVLGSGGTSVVVAPTRLSASGNNIVRVLIISSTAIVLTRNGANVVAYTVNLSTLAVSAATNLRTDGLATPFDLDACVIGTNFVIVYGVTAAGGVKVYSYNTSLAQQATATVEAGINSLYAGIDGASGESLYVVYYPTGGGTNLRMAVHNPSTLAQTVAPFTVESVAGGFLQCSVCRFDSSNALVAYTTSESPGRLTTYKVTSAGSVTTSSERGTWGLKQVSRPFMVNGRCYILAHDLISAILSTYQGNNTYLCEVETSTKGSLGSFVPHRILGKVDHLIGGQTVNGNVPNVVAASSTSFLVAAPFLATAPQKITTWRQGVRLVTISFGASLPSDMWKSVNYGQESYLFGAGPMAYDGRSVFEHGFFRQPVLLTGVINNPAGAIVAGNYLYGFYDEYRSQAGVLHRGPTSTWTVSVAGTPSTVALTLVNQNITNKQTISTGFASVSAVGILQPIYRTVVNGSTYYRETYDPTFNVVNVDPMSRTQTLTDSRADASIDGAGTVLSTRPTLYTTGGIVDDEHPVSSLTAAYMRGRLWMLASDARTWWFSKSFQDDAGVAPGFSTSFRIAFDQDMTGAIAMDEKSVFFSQNAIWYMFGDGPAANGQNSDFTNPQQLQTDVGCTNPRSLVSTPDGIMFLSDHGIYLLTRKMEAVWIGKPVQDVLAAFPNITSAVSLPKYGQVRFTCNNAAGSSGVVLVYNYTEQQWSVFKYSDGSTASVPIADAVLWNGVYTFATTGGKVFTESESTYLDAGSTWVAIKMETAWISAAGPLAFQSVRNFALNGISATNHDLVVSVGFDSNTTYQQTATFLAGSAVTATGDLEECTVSIGNRRKCESIRFKIEDATPTSPGTYPVTTGQGPIFEAMALEVGAKKGLSPEPATKRG